MPKTERDRQRGRRAQRHDVSPRAAPTPGQVLDRAKPIGLSFDGKKVSAFDGDTIASAVHAAGISTWGRSFLYHRPRGLFCVTGKCPNCMVNADGVPNVRACTEPVRDGMKVKRQNGWPSADFDLFSGVRTIEAFLPVGFYYKTFIHFPIEWSYTGPLIRRMTGRGSVKSEIRSWKAEGGHGRDDGFRKRSISTDLLVIGGGPAGVAAALEAARSGAKVLLLDDQPALGGHLRYDAEPVDLGAADERDLNGIKGFELAKRLDETAKSEANLTVLDNTTAFGFYESNEVAAVRGKTMLKIRPRRVIVATGTSEYSTPFPNNDLPGILLGRGARRMLGLYGVLPGRSVLIATNNDSAFGLARLIIVSGAKVAAFADSRRRADADSPEYEFLKRAGVPVFAGYAVKEAHGGKRVTGATLAKVGDDGRPLKGSEKRLECDSICLANGFEPDSGLLTQAGCKVAYDELLGEFVPSETLPSVRACGEVTGIHDLACSYLQAKVAALSSLVSAGGADREARLVELSKLRDAAEARYRARIEALGPGQSLWAAPPRTGGKRNEDQMKGFVCICEDVMEKEISQAVEEGFDDIETLKRYSTLTMGPCEGKMCAGLGIRLCARETGRSIQETGRTVSRPPYLPVPMGALAGPGLHPVKLTAMHYKHIEAGATMMDMGEWKRPHTYSTVFGEYAAVRKNVGIIDLSTLGRLDVKGPDSAKLLDFVYTHQMSRLQPGRSRYGVICDDAGTILDDGTVTRLSENHYFITTSTGNIDFVEQWLTWWALAKNHDAQVTNLTSGLAAVNVAGPRARDLLKKLTEVDLSTDKFPYMASASAKVAGVPCILLRIGFVGETGWEIHFPAEYGEYFWDKLLAAGKEFDVKPFGVETQRLLRLEKKHIIVGQDTDALSNPYEAEMAWVVKLDKEDFVGKAALTFSKDEAPQRRLVGFVLDDQRVPHDGDQVFSPDGSTLVGVVTSCRFSPVAGRAVGLALIRSDLAIEGGTLAIATATVKIEATIHSAPFYDPEGKRLRS